jgi:hypothetical protein
MTGQRRSPRNAQNRSCGEQVRFKCRRCRLLALPQQSLYGERADRLRRRGGAHGRRRVCEQVYRVSLSRRARAINAPTAGLTARSESHESLAMPGEAT